MTGGNGPHYTDVAGMNSQSFLWLIRFLGTSVFLGGSAPKPPAFAALDQWHEERPGCAPRRERSWRIRGTRCGGGYSFGRKHAERRSNPGHRRCDRSRWHRLAHIMLLAQSEKCQGSGDSVPGLCLVSIQKVPENRMSLISSLSQKRAMGFEPTTSSLGS